MIYTRFGTAVKFVSAEEVTVLIERTRDGSVRWHYPEKLPKKRLKTSKYTEEPIWHVVCKDVKTGELIVNGNQISFHEFKADDGIREIIAALREIVGRHVD